MRYSKLGSEDVGESTSRRHVDPETGHEEINITDQDLSATPPLEEEPEFRDIMPDQIRSFSEDGVEQELTDEEDDDREITAQPAERIRPITAAELPEG